MKRPHWIPALLLAISAGLLPADTPTPPESIRIEELQLVIRSLRSQNQELRERNDLLSRELIALRRRLETLLASQPSVPTPAPDPEPPPPGHEILDVNPNWHYLLLAAGTADNLEAGMEGRILRDNTEIARARITAVKPAQSVADILLPSLGDSGQYPRPGDRILFLRSPTPGDPAP